MHLGILEGSFKFLYEFGRTAKYVIFSQHVFQETTAFVIHAIHRHLAGLVVDLTARHEIILLLVFPPINLDKAIVPPSVSQFFSRALGREPQHGNRR